MNILVLSRCEALSAAQDRIRCETGIISIMWGRDMIQFCCHQKTEDLLPGEKLQK